MSITDSKTRFEAEVSSLSDSNARNETYTKLRKKKWFEVSHVVSVAERQHLQQ